MIDTDAAEAATILPDHRVGWDAERGVFIFPERELAARAVMPGVALLRPNGARAQAQPRPAFTLCDPARLTRRRRRCPSCAGKRHGELKVAAWIVGGVALSCGVVWALAQRLGSF